MNFVFDIELYLLNIMIIYIKLYLVSIENKEIK